MTQCNATDVLSQGGYLEAAVRATCTKAAGHVTQGDPSHWDEAIRMGWED